jgi:hypothetical protein
MTIQIYGPEGAIAPDSAELAATPMELSGLRLVVLDNGKPNAALVMERLATYLGHRAGTELAFVAKKGPGSRSANAAIPCAPDVFDRVVAAADLVLTGTADCGSCTAYSVYDAVQLERTGLPCVVVTTTMFEAVARTMARDFGMPNLRILVLPHPLGGTAPDRLDAWAQAALDDLEALFSPVEGPRSIEDRAADGLR